jgi:putative oxidoreductase
LLGSICICVVLSRLFAIDREKSMAGSTAVSHGTGTISVPKGAIVLLGRLFFALIFLMATPQDFTKQGIAYAASQGAPLASIGVPLMGIISLAGGLSVLLGYRARIGACLMVLFLLVVTPLMHKFWGLTDPAVAQLQMIRFLKNLSILGGALLITQFGAGPLSLDARRSL